MNLENIDYIEKQYYTKDLITNKKRYWDPNRSKICAALKNKINCFPIKNDSKILYLGCAEGYTVSYLSDIVKNGLIIGLDVSGHSMQRFYLLAKERGNIVPLLEDAHKPERYKELIDFKVDVVIQDVSQKKQIEILKKNTDLFLKDNGYVMLSLKTTAISQKKTKDIITDEVNNFKKYFKLIDVVTLEPYEKKHVFIVGQKLF
jgi:fibrillarin-like pre-rRNA processing protein